MIAGDWSIPISSDLHRKTVGIVGLGRVGRSVVQRLAGFEVRILAFDAQTDKAYAITNKIEYTDLNTLLQESDYITLHAPLLPETTNLINENSIRLLKPTAILVNAARGGLVEDRDLLDALKARRLAGAALDVFLSERDPTYKPVTEELISLPNVVATPHSAASSLEGLACTNMVAAQCVVAVLDGKTLPEACVIADGRQKRSLNPAS
jgi:D-3-phosphoglycerate dehydrogenase